jgi:hypothetical protein
MEQIDFVQTFGTYGKGYVTDSLKVLFNWILNTKTEATMRIVTPNYGTYNVHFYYDGEDSSGDYCIDESDEYSLVIAFDIVKDGSENVSKFSDKIYFDNNEDSGNTIEDAISWFESSFLMDESFCLISKLM